MKITLILLALLIAFLQLIRLELINDLVPANFRYIQITDEIASYRKKNILLKEQLLEKASLTEINEEARKEGFIKGKVLFESK